MFQTQFILAYVRRLTGVITNWGSYYKLEQLLEIGANFITNWGSHYKLGHNSYNY